jgi:peroxiredoxin
VNQNKNQTTSEQQQKMIQVGDPIPSVPLQENEPGNKVNLAEVLKDKKKVILFGLPGVCS